MHTRKIIKNELLPEIGNKLQIHLCKIGNAKRNIVSIEPLFIAGDYRLWPALQVLTHKMELVILNILVDCGPFEVTSSF